MNGNNQQAENDDESYVHQFDETYSTLNDLHDEIITVDDQLDDVGPAIRLELANAKKAISNAKTVRMLTLTDGDEGAA